jgi:hypothetical protein
MAIKYYPEIIQGTDEWHRLRLGVVTASTINTLITPKGAPAKGQKVKDHACNIAAQRILKRIEDTYQSYDMLRGTLQEGIARDVYSENFAKVDEVGFITNNEHGFLLGCSPDGLVGEDGGIEVKSRLSKFQIRTIIDGRVPDEFMNQIQAFLIVSGRKWCDFCQYSNGMPMFVKRVEPDTARQTTIIEAVAAFELEVFAILDEYRERSAKLVPCEWVDLVNDGEIQASDG